MTTETGPIRKQLSPEEAQPYIKMARNLLGELRTQQELGSVNYLKREIILPDETQITAIVNGALAQVQIITPEEEGVVEVCAPWIEGFVGLARSEGAGPSGDTSDQFFNVIALRTNDEDLYRPYYYSVDDLPEGVSVSTYDLYTDEGVIVPWYDRPFEYGEVDWYNPDDETIPAVSFRGTGCRGITRSWFDITFADAFGLDIFMLGFRLARTENDCWGAAIRRIEGAYYLYAIIEDTAWRSYQVPWAFEVVRMPLPFLPFGCHQYDSLLLEGSDFPLSEWESVYKTGPLDQRGLNLVRRDNRFPDLPCQPWYINQEATRAAITYGDFGIAVALEMDFDRRSVRTAYQRGPDSLGDVTFSFKDQQSSGDWWLGCQGGEDPSSGCCGDVAPDSTGVRAERYVAEAQIPGFPQQYGFSHINGVLYADYQNNQLQFVLMSRDASYRVREWQISDTWVPGFDVVPTCGIGEFGTPFSGSYEYPRWPGIANTTDDQPWMEAPQFYPLSQGRGEAIEAWDAAGGATVDGFETAGDHGVLVMGPIKMFVMRLHEIAYRVGQKWKIQVVGGKPPTLSEREILQIELKYLDLRHDFILYYEFFGRTRDATISEHEIPIAYVELVAKKGGDTLFRNRLNGHQFYDYVPRLTDQFGEDFIFESAVERGAAIDRHGNIFISVDPEVDFYIGDPVNYLSADPQSGIDEMQHAQTLLQTPGDRVRYEPVGLI